jgi:tight adherence protein C
MEALIALFVGLAVTTLFASVILARQRGQVQLVRFRRRGGAASDDVLDRPFLDRTLLPLLQRVSAWPARLLPAQLLADLDARLVTAGLTIGVRTFLAIWAVIALGLPALFVLWGVVNGLGALAFSYPAALGLLVGLVFPWYWLRRRASTRIRAIGRTLPNAIDFIVTSVEAGVGLQGAMLNMSRKFEGPIADEFLQTVRETALGRSREAAMLAMAERCHSEDLSLLVSAVVHAEQTGIPIARVLRNQAAELRSRRRLRAREEAGKVPTRMTIPTVLLVFPTLFLLILGPVALRAMETLNGTGGSGSPFAP